jgi:pimeloyl-ACP methyl ester carboxylesterase
MLPLLIYLPGMEGTGKLFYRQQPELSERYEVVCLPSRCKPPFDYEDLVCDIVDVIDQHGTGKATIVAESFGGTVALKFAIAHQNRIEQLVLINTFPYFRRRLRLHAGRMLLPLTFIRFGNAVREFVYRTALSAEGVPKEDVQRLCECSFLHGYQTSCRRMELIRDFDVRKEISKIQVPVTLIASARDKLIPSVREAKYMASLVPNARLIILPDHGHTPLITPTFSLARSL